MSDAPHLLVFEPMPLGGHRLGYLQHLLDAWCRLKLGGRLSLVLAHDALQQHPRLDAFISKTSARGISAWQIDRPNSVALRNGGSLLRKGVREGRLLKHWVEQLNPTVCMVMYFDHIQISFALNLHFSHPVKVGAIYFRPTFHYPEFAGFRGDLRDNIRLVRQRLVLAAAVRNRHLKTLFCLDPYSVPYVNSIGLGATAVPMPDPVRIYASSGSKAALRIRLGIDPGRKVILLFGALGPNKGLAQLFQSLDHVSTKKCQEICIVLAGTMPDSMKDTVHRLAGRIKTAQPVQIVLEDRFIQDEEIQPFFEMADFVALPYQRHVGMSAVLVRAAAAGVPVLASDYGLLGELTRRHRLGVTMDAQSPKAIARIIEESLDAGPASLIDAAEAAGFARQNSVENYVTVLFDQMLG